MQEDWVQPMAELLDDSKTGAGWMIEVPDEHPMTASDMFDDSGAQAGWMEDALDPGK